MTLNKKLKAFVDEAKQTDSYWVESAKLEFALNLEQQRRAAGLSYADLAKKMGTSAARCHSAPPALRISSTAATNNA